MKNYIRYSVSAIPFNADLLSGMLWELPLSGLVEEEGYLNLFAEEDAKLSQNDIADILERLQNENVIESFDVSEETFADRNWNEEWEKNIQVIEVTDKIVIKPSFKEYEPKPGQIILEIDPKMSFGTGEHASTRLVLKLMEKYGWNKDRVLDVGSGTGVLAICAAKMNGGMVIAIDNNEWCFVNGKENLTRNKVEDKIDVRLCEISDVSENEFDLILANINKNVLMTINEELANRMSNGGKLILSGILIVDKEDIVNKYTEVGLKLIDSLEEDEWTGFVFEK